MPTLTCADPCLSLQIDNFEEKVFRRWLSEETRKHPTIFNVYVSDLGCSITPYDTPPLCNTPTGETGKISFTASKKEVLRWSFSGLGDLVLAKGLTIFAFEKLDLAGKGEELLTMGLWISNGQNHQFCLHQIVLKSDGVIICIKCPVGLQAHLKSINPYLCC